MAYKKKIINFMYAYRNYADIFRHLKKQKIKLKRNEYLG